jgi:hypothetical protein
VNVGGSALAEGADFFAVRHLKAELEIVRRVAPNATADDADQSRRHATGNAAGRG